MGLVFLVGGARSGKSRLAQRLAAASCLPVTFVATGQPLDAEMEERISRHRAERPAGWRTVEEPRDLAGALSAADPGDCVVVDCLTLWVANALNGPGAAVDGDAVLAEAAACAALASSRAAPTIVVSNEVGLGVVPPNPLARAYRDALGAVNALFAGAAERALLVVAGRALDLARVEDLTAADLLPVPRPTSPSA